MHEDLGRNLHTLETVSLCSETLAKWFFYLPPLNALSALVLQISQISLVSWIKTNFFVLSPSPPPPPPSHFHQLG